MRTISKFVKNWEQIETTVEQFTRPSLILQYIRIDQGKST